MHLIANVFVLILSTHLSAAYSKTAYYELGSVKPEDDPHQLRLWLSISAQRRFVEISWKNAPAQPDDYILLTKTDPQSFSKTTPPKNAQLADSFSTDGSGGEIFIEGSSSGSTISLADETGSGWEPKNSIPRQPQREHWISNNGYDDIVVAIKPMAHTQWYSTGVPFDFELSRNVTINTNCYGYWASYINGNGDILAKNCIRAHPRWMHDLHSTVSNLRVRDLFIPGTHDSGSYRTDFDPLLQETLVTKYALTQDDDIRGQLMHGARYLDIRVGYYRNTKELFYINHGITRQVPLIEVIEQVKDFVLETNEIVIFGLKEFPVGFKRDLGVHRLLVSYLREQFGDLIVHPSLTWSSLIGAIWERKQNVILAYDLPAMVEEFPQLLFGSVEQRWGNVQTWSKLETHLRNVNNLYISRLSSRPVADMAELTPETWDVLLDKYGGLRKMADRVNWRVSQLYRDDIGHLANIVAVDFIRGTSLMEIAIDYNKRKVIYE